VTLPNTKIEFIQPLGEASPIAKFVERNADGGIHHICYDVPDIIAGARQAHQGRARRVLGDGVPKIGAHGKTRAVFSTPRIFSGALVEIEQKLNQHDPEKVDTGFPLATKRGTRFGAEIMLKSEHQIMIRSNRSMI